MQDTTHTVWTQGHFIGGHPALDLANAVFDRAHPAPDNELLKSTTDLGNWLHALGLANHQQAAAVARITDGAVMERAHAVREATFSIFDAIAAGKAPASATLASLLAQAATGLSVTPLKLDDTRPVLTSAQWRQPDAVIGFLAMSSIDAFFALPRDRVRSCPRCGWVFVDASRGGKRRWCSMQICGNREKVSRHRVHGHV